ncbi:hypothetical protein K438DRAFT_1759980 [Mycena galopus ATCC 62051]|nr:hypothetical protein K438DRAFT_1759980 [Mycena galopus ATCC 62051]
MSTNITIIVVLGSRKAGEQLVTSHNSALNSTENGTLFQGGRAAQSNIQLLPGYSPKRRFLLHTFETRETLVHIERKVTADIQRVGAVNSNIGGIVFMCNGKYSDPAAFPFHDDTRFLGLKGKSLVEKLMVILLRPNLAPLPHFLDLSRRGMRIVDISEPRVVLPRLLTWVADGVNARRIEIPGIYSKAAQSARRSSHRAVILLAGQTQHGKSKTMNRLIGQEVLNVGKHRTLGSTTEARLSFIVIQRVEVHNISKELLSEITVAFDDTPGFENTTFEDRELNASLLRIYKIKHFQDTYPNVILLVAAWESIALDAHNEPAHFTSAIGKTIYALHRSNLVDDHCANIVVTVTKSLSSFHQFDDYKTLQEKYAQWRIEAGRRRGIITDLQRKMFPRSSPWEIVFIENGGGSDMRAKFPVLPDGLLSHQNLYDAIHTTIKRPGSDGSLDLVGIQALQVLTGAASLGSFAEAKTQVLVGGWKQEVVKLEEITRKLPDSPRQVIQNLASTYFGVTYNNALRTFGWTNILTKQQIIPQSVHEKHPKVFHKISIPFTRGESESHPTKDGLRSHYSSDWAFRAALSQNSQCWIDHCKTQTVEASDLKLSREMQNLIQRLPPWSPEYQHKYGQFFTNYGTHVVTRLVLGGTVRVIIDGQGVMIFRDGGASVAGELAAHLAEDFPPSASSVWWRETRDKWIQALEGEPVFCPDHELTTYKPIYELHGLTPDQRIYLERAYGAYMANTKTSDRTVFRAAPDSPLQRDVNLAEAAKLLLDAVTHALYRFQQGR